MIYIKKLFRILNRHKKGKALSVTENLKTSFDRIKDEFQDHLDSINENTNEISANYEYLLQLDNKIEKLNEKLDEVMMFISQLQGKSINKEIFKNIILNSREQEIFLLLYARNGDLIDAKEIAKLIGLTEEKVRKYISNLNMKGIPIIKKYMDSMIYYILDYDFRNLQAKENIIKLNESIARDLHNKKVI
ncbi:HTH domain-containing protein [Candidatus Woesearchaeota archaeon]|nr:HTH domain-containing protein [Candidatus Woesearchaeota archaeon]